MTFDLGRIVVTHPDLKEEVELLLLHEGELIFRTVKKYDCGRYGSYEKQRWYQQSLALGKPWFIMDDGRHDELYYDPEPDGVKRFAFDGLVSDVNAKSDVVSKTVATLVQSNVSGDDIRKGLESSGMDMKSLYPTNYKLEHNYLSGWKVKTVTGEASVNDFLVRLYELTTT